MFRFISSLALILLASYSFAQASLSGKVMDDQGNPLPGAVVFLKGTIIGTTVNAEGNYQLRSLPAGEFVVVARFLGYQTQEAVVQLEGGEQTLDFQLPADAFVTDEVVVSATRANENTPMAYTDLNKEAIEANNVGVDLPFLLDQTPSLVVTSDAGTGIGYTGLRIRGTDPTRINITINGIPLNDAESHGVFWVNMPDFATSTDNIQIQRGVGTSTNGAGAFGGSINLQTNQLKPESYGEILNTVGSFNTMRNTVSFGSGLLNEHFTVEGRLSSITSDGYIDRASADLQSFYTSGAYSDDKTSIRVNIFGGQERTFQAWGGVPKDSLATNRTYNIYDYENEVDDYTQSHYQLLFTRQLAEPLTFSAALHYTEGRGFFEQFREADDIVDYGIDTTGLTASEQTADLVRRRWLDNDFYGATYSFTYNGGKKLQLIVGGGWNRYEGRHFGEVIWAQSAQFPTPEYVYYDNDAEKTDFNTYAKANYQLTKELNLFADMQYRTIEYTFLGLTAQGTDATQTANLNFFNPKAGLSYDLGAHTRIFGSFAVGNKEPNRDDFTESSPDSRPEHETLYDYELGFQQKFTRARIGVNLYYMQYDNQLVLTGAINDVGASTRVNIPNSFRRGIEIEGGYQFTSSLRWTANATFSQNEIESFTEFVDDFDNGGKVEVQHNNTDIAFSPSVIGASTITLDVMRLLNASTENKMLEVAALTKYVGEQFIDNTSNSNHVIDPYLVQDLRLTFRYKNLIFKEIEVIGMIRNVLDEEYETNAWSYRFSLNDQITTDSGYYPQAGRNYMLGLNLKF